MALECGDLLARYRLYRAARYLGVAPWDLEQQPYEYLSHALAFERVEGEVQEHLADKARVRERG